MKNQGEPQIQNHVASSVRKPDLPPTTSQMKDENNTNSSENHNSSQKSDNLGVQEGGRFDPEYINNRHHLPSILTSSHLDEDDGQTRLSSNSEIPSFAATSSHRIEEEPSPKNTSTNLNIGRDEQQTSHQANGDENGFATDASIQGGFTEPAGQTPDHRPLPTNLADIDDVNEMPTWLKKLSIFQNYSFNNDANSNRWKDIKQAFNKKFRKDSQMPSQGQRREHIFPESEAQARMRASNLITSLLAGSPAALFAGVSFTMDEHNDRRAPLLLSLLGLEVKEISTTRGHHKKFQIELEYGVGDNRLKWAVVKDLRALISLHSKLRVSLFQFKNLRGTRTVDLPKFPKFKEDSEEKQGATLNDKYLSERNQEPQSPPRNNFQSFQDEHRNIETPENATESLIDDALNSTRGADDDASMSNHSATTTNDGNGGFRNRLQSIISRVSYNGSHEGLNEQDYFEQNEVFRR
ncbi:hypothetical protein WICPIJ_002574, partial [Wickerhamomyces pijperi]